MAFTLNKDKIRQIPLESLIVNPAQPRSRFGEDDLKSLAQSIKTNGLLQPVAVRDVGGGRYQLIAGERRCRAYMMLGHIHIPAIVINCTLQDSAVLALTENIQRQDLDPFEQAEGISRLIGYWGVTQEDAAAKLGLAQSTLANKLRLLRLSPGVQDAIRKNGFSERHARALLKLPDEQTQLKVIAIICQKGLTVAQTEKYIETLLTNQKTTKPTRLFICKDVRLFLNTIDKAVKTMEQAGLAVKSDRRDDGEYIEMTIRVPKEAIPKAAAVAPA